MMGKKDHKTRNKTKTYIDNSNKGVRKQTPKYNQKSNKKKVQLQIKQLELETVDLKLSEISNSNKPIPVEGSLQTRRLMEHHAKDKELTKRIEKDKAETEQNIKEQAALIDGFSIL